MKDFDFDLNAPIRKVTDDQILQSLRNFYRYKGEKPFTQSEYNGWKDRICHSCTISERFGTWRKALEKVGIKKVGRGTIYAALELMDNLENVWRTLGYPPGKRKIGKYGYGISERPYINRWGSLRNACRLLAQYKKGQIAESELLRLENAPKRRNISLKDRWEVLNRDNYQCKKCGARPPEVTLEIDHIVPIAKGGGNSEANLQTLCNRCNQGKKDHL